MPPANYNFISDAIASLLLQEVMMELLSVTVSVKETEINWSWL